MRFRKFTVRKAGLGCSDDEDEDGDKDIGAQSQKKNLSGIK